MSTKNAKKSRRKSDTKEVLDFFKKPLKSNKKMEKEAVTAVQEEEAKIETVNSEEGIKTRSSTPLKPVQEEIKTDAEKTDENDTADKNKTAEEEAVSDEMEKPVVDEVKEVEKPVEENVVEEVVTNDEAKPNETEKSDDLVDIVEGHVIEAVQEEVVVSTNGIKEHDANDEDVEMEPLVIDSEEADPELQFDENSDGDSHKGSPVVSRCRTRRSQTRNIPTPKTPKSVLEQNGDDVSEKPSSTPEIPELCEKPAELNDTQDSIGSCISTKVNVGSDVTREIDLTLPDKDSFINTAKELTVVETMRRLSSRRSIHTSADYRRTVLKSNTERKNLTLPHSKSSRSSVEKLSAGTKRKNRSTTPDGVKRFKPEPTQTGFLSYISSPLQKIRGRFAPKEVSASTPKLTGYRKADLLEEAEFSKIESESEANQTGEKKWCSIM